MAAKYDERKDFVWQLIINTETQGSREEASLRCSVVERRRVSLNDLIGEAIREFVSEASAEIVELCRGEVDRLIAGGLCTDSRESGGSPVSRDSMCRMIDHTNLRPTATQPDIESLVADAVSYGFASVCVNPFWVPLVRKLLDATRSEVRLCTVVGFPLGADNPSVKAEEARVVIGEGVDEVDMVINIGALKGRDYGRFVDDARAVVDACGGSVTKAIIETCYLEDAEKVKACIVLASLGYDFVKTSTGFGKHGALASDVSLMRAVVGPRVRVKASGGIRTYDDAMTMIRAGADRIGTSAGVSIVSQCRT